VDYPAQGLALARQHQSPDAFSVWQLALAAETARLYLLSDLPMAIVEDLSMTPLEHPSQVQRLVNGAASCLFLADAHRTLALIKS
jgi:hypothetical protein